MPFPVIARRRYGYYVAPFVTRKTARSAGVLSVTAAAAARTALATVLPSDGCRVTHSRSPQPHRRRAIERVDYSSRSVTCVGAAGEPWPRRPVIAAISDRGKSGLEAWPAGATVFATTLRGAWTRTRCWLSSGSPQATADRKSGAGWADFPRRSREPAGSGRPPRQHAPTAFRKRLWSLLTSTAS
jgi:hypothetical protein